MPRDDNPKNPIPPVAPGVPFNPDVQRQLIREQVNEMIDDVAKQAVIKVLKEHGIDINPYEQPAIDPNAPRAYTSEEVTKQFLESVAHRIHYWQTQPNCGTMEDRVAGVVHSVFAILDGRTLPLPAFDLVPAPCDGDKEYHIDNGENYYDPKQYVSVSLTEMLYPTLRELYGPDASGARGPELTPQEMREEFISTVYRIADGFGSFTQEKGMCQELARSILHLIDGNYIPTMPPFMLFAAPSREFDQQMVEQGKPRWVSHIPLNRKASTYGEEDSLVQTYDEIRERHNRAARDMFK
jgi:hypothetical protein